ncbi:MAG TPA: kynureninase [Phycisphaerales bacterium]|nr:kynureninase [Phycisphaerales bacterium]
MEFRSDEAFASSLDAADPLQECRGLFHIPPSAKDPSRPCVYMTGNSLGCQPMATRALLEQELEDWARLGVGAHLHGRDPWLPYHEWFREPAARLVGGVPGECVMMNSLTTNLHLLMVSFFRPTSERYKIVIEDTAFPSDSYAVASQLRFHGIDPKDGLIRLRPRDGEHTLRTSDIEAFLWEQGQQVALVMLGAVNYLTGQWFDMQRITAAAKERGCTVGWDLAHAAGNVPMKLHDWGVDFAAWCTYKYLNSGPGAVAGAFVHERHFKVPGTPPLRGGSSLPRFEGWWGTQPATRFQMRPTIEPMQSAEAWQLSNPPIMALAPVKASMQIFDRVGMGALREKSEKITGYLEWLITRELPGKVQIITPREREQRGAQLSLAVSGATRDFEKRMHAQGVVVDFREPNVVRVAPAPLYVSYRDCWELVQVLKRVL